MSERVNKSPTIQDLLIDRKYLIESWRNENISVIYIPVRKISDKIPINGIELKKSRK